MKRSALAAALFIAIVAVPSGASGDRTVAVERFEASMRVPDSWHRSRQRLVPKLLMPREIISVGTFGMAPGGGGNCGREPAVAITRMEPGGALVSVQEYDVTKRMRPHLTRSFRPLDEGIAVGPEEAATIPFSIHGRAFDALVYFGSRPSAAERAEVAEILGSFRG